MTTGVHTRLVLIRHAHVDTQSRLCGTLDVPLSATGRAQLDRLLQGRHAHPPDALYTSPLQRAHEVAACLARAWQLPLERADALREICCGTLEGIDIDLLRTRYPELWARNVAQTDESFTWPAGESYRQFRRRVMAGLQHVVSRHRGQRVAVVTHAGVITQVLGWLAGRSAAVWSADRPAPLTATEVQWNDAGPEAVLSWNDPHWY